MFWTVFAALIAVSVILYLAGVRRAHAVADGQYAGMHTLPTFHGSNLVIYFVLPALVAAIIWHFASRIVVDNMVLSAAHDAIAGLSSLEVNAFLRDARAIAFGNIVSSETPEKIAGAEHVASLTIFSNVAIIVVVAALVAAGA